MTEIDPNAFRLAFRETPNPALITDTNFAIVAVNDALVSFTGYEREDILGETPLWLFDSSVIYDEAVGVLAVGDAWTGDFEAVAHSGAPIYGHGSAAPLFSDGELCGYVGIFTDLTKSRRYERSVRVLDRVLRHDLRNDTNIILGHLETAIETVDDPDSLSSLRTAYDRVRMLLDRAETTRHLHTLLTDAASNLGPVRLDEAIRDALDGIDTSEATVTVDVPSISVLGDHSLSRAVEVVVRNAIVHNDTDAPVIEISVECTDDAISLSIADDGPGIPPDHRDQAFGREEWTQLHHGEGLSLFFVDRLMEVYGGRIDVVDNDPSGSVFVFELRPVDDDSRGSGPAS